MKKILFLLLLLTVMGCTNNENPNPAGDEVQIRVKNLSAFTFDQVFINTSGGENMYVSVAPGEVSDYKRYDFTYRYAFVRVEIAGQTYAIVPTDYVGEEKMFRGKFTYELNVESSTLSLFGELKAD